MVIGVSVVLFLAIVLVVAFPLFFQETVSHISSATSSSDFSEQDAILSALTDLEEEFQLGKLSESDYHHLKLHFQRNYLHVKKTS